MGRDISRRFLRHKKDAEIPLYTAKGSFTARLLEYSPFGMMVESPASLDMYEPVKAVFGGVTSRGRVVWHRGVKTGVEFKSPFRGSLREYSIADFLTGLKTAEKTGVLRISAHDVNKSIYIKNGDPVFAESECEEEDIAAFLLRRGKMTPEAYRGIVTETGGKGRPQGALLVQLGYLTAHELFFSVKEQVGEMIGNTFRITDGDVVFEEHGLDRGIVPLKLNFPSLLYRGIKGMDDEEYVRGLLPGMDAVLGASGDPHELFKESLLEDGEKAVLNSTDGRKTLGAVLQQSPLEVFATLKILYLLLSLKVLEPRWTEGVSARTVDAEFLERVKDLACKCEDMDYYEILGSTRDSALSDIKKAYYHKVKQYHPDKFFWIQDEDFKDRLSRIFSRINQAYAVLSTTHTRQTYNRSSDAKKSPADIAQAKFGEGLGQFRAGSIPSALQLFAQAVYLDDSQPQYHYHHGLALRTLRRYKESENAFLNALKRSPGNSEYLAELGHLYLELGMRVRAKKTFERALSVSGDNKRALEGIAVAGEKEGKK